MKRIRKNRKNLPVILTNDPSMTGWGWAIISIDGDVIETGCIKTENNVKKLRIRAGDDRIRRINEILEVLLSLKNKYNIRLILSELPHGSQNASGAVMIGMCCGIIETLSRCFKIPIEWYSENDAKKSLFDKGQVSKSDMIEKISELYDIKLRGIKYIDEAVCDSIAIHYTAVKNSNLLKLLIG